ncbi:MAG: hypothetical protein CSA62_03850 [Planctomycetota bacterium]|nr:MAG: hypothetical protein CSA62_03850 [Planctomycetota bacterium]
MLLAVTSGLWAQNQARGLQVTHRHGQTFLTWKELSRAQGERYRIYRSPLPIRNPSDLGFSQVLAERGRGSGWHSFLGQGYVLAANGQPLAAGTGFLVVTTPKLRCSYYAVTTVIAKVENTGLGKGNSSGPILESVAPLRPVLQAVKDKGRDQHWVHFAPAVSTRFVQAQSAQIGRVFDYRIWVDRATAGPRPVLFFLHPKGASYRSWTRMDWAPRNAVQIFCDDKNPPGGNDFWFGYRDQYPNTPSASSVVIDYSERRLLWTLDQVIGDRQFLCDSSRVYAIGASLGAIAAVGLGTRHADRFAAAGGLLPAFSLTHSDFALGNEVSALFGAPSLDLASSLGPKVYSLFDAVANVQKLRAKGIAPMRFTFGRSDTVTGWADKPPMIRAAQNARQPLQFYWDYRTHSSLGAWSTLESKLFAELMQIRLDRPCPAFTHLSLDDDPGPGDRFKGDAVGTVGGYAQFDPATAFESNSLVRLDVGLRSDRRRRDYAPAARGFVDLSFRRLRSFSVTPGYYLVRSRPLQGSGVIEERVIAPDANAVLTVSRLELERGFRRIELSRYQPKLPELRFSGTLKHGGSLGMQLLAAPRSIALLILGSKASSIATRFGTWGIADPMVLWSGLVPKNGIAELLIDLPADPKLRGLKLLGQGFAHPKLSGVAKATLR